MKPLSLACGMTMLAGCAPQPPAPAAPAPEPVRVLPAPIPPIQGAMVTAFALRWVDVAPGAGAAVQPRQCLYVHYTGWLTDGTTFDSSRDTLPSGRPREPIAFPQGARRVIAGWEAGFEGMRVGGRRRLFIPYQMAYGEPGRPPRIPPRAELIFDVEVMAVADTLAGPAPATPSAPAGPRCAPWTAVSGASSPARPPELTIQYRAPSGVDYRADPDTGVVAAAMRALATDPGNVDRILAVGLAQASVRQYRQAIETFTRGLAAAPDRAMLYRWRGHRYLSTRQFDLALADLTRGLALDGRNYGILFHLGIVRFARSEFALAATMFERAIPLAPDAGEQSGSTDWLWMSLMRAGRAADAAAMLARRPDALTATNYYAQRLRLYRGEIGPDQLIGPADTADVALATLRYGLGHWYLVRGDTARARAEFQRTVQGTGWPAFGFILAEVELQRTR